MRGGEREGREVGRTDREQTDITDQVDWLVRLIEKWWIKGNSTLSQC